MVCLSATLTQADSCCGKPDSSIAVANDVIARAKAFADIESIYHTKLACLMQQNLFQEAREVVYSVFDTLNLSLSDTFLQVTCSSRRIADQEDDEWSPR